MDVVFAVDTGVLNMPGGGGFYVQRGTHWPADDPLVLAFPHWFTADPRYGLQWTGDPPAEMNQPPIEQTTAGPGEKRNVRVRGR